METIYIHEYNSPWGELIIGEYQNQLCLCDWKYRKLRSSIDERIQKYFDASYEIKKTLLIDEVINALQKYANKELKEFNLPLIFAGTDFQKSVWNELIQIHYGKTSTYLELSKKLKNEAAIRAVANANGANAISIIVPCHRVIGSNNELVGYAGGLSAKKKLLELENAIQFTPSLFD